MLGVLLFEVTKFWLKITSVGVLHEDAERGGLGVEKGGFVGDYVGDLDGG